jgi:ER-bound oxygenase mpaB/B'/Rubber oxygenase, catalytic domain
MSSDDDGFFARVEWKHRRWCTFTPTNLWSSQRMMRVLEKKHPNDCYLRRNLYGQVLLGAPFSTHATHASGGRCIFDESIFETYYRQRGDEMMDAVLELYHQEERDVRPSWDLIAYGMHLRSRSEPPSSPADQALVEFLNYCAHAPDWLEEPRLRRGQQIFVRYLPAIGAALFYRSLVPGFSLPKIAAVLHATAYLAPPASATQVRTRLMDTGAFLAHVATASPSAEPEVWMIVLQVRLLHAKVRFALQHRHEEHASAGPKAPWNADLYGVPINQEDLAATLLAFSYNSLLGIEYVLGTPLSRQDQEDFLHFWRYVGWLLGVETAHDVLHLQHMRTSLDYDVTPPDNNPFPPLDPCGPGWINDRPNPLEHAYAMFASILLHLSKPDATSVQIAHHLLRLGRRPNPQLLTKPKDEPSNDMWFYFRCYQCRRFVGDELANALLLPYHPVWWKRYQIQMYSTIYLLLLRLYTWASVPSSPLQWILYRWHERNLFKFVQSWRGTKFRKTWLPLANASLPSEGEYPSHKSDVIGSLSSNSCPFAMVAPPQY